MNEFIPKKPDKDIISIRISHDLLEQIDRNAAKVDISRNEFINQCISYALEHLKEEKEGQ